MFAPRDPPPKIISGWSATLDGLANICPCEHDKRVLCLFTALALKAQTATEQLEQSHVKINLDTYRRRSIGYTRISTNRLT